MYNITYREKELSPARLGPKLSKYNLILVYEITKRMIVLSLCRYELTNYHHPTHLNIAQLQIPTTKVFTFVIQMTRKK